AASNYSAQGGSATTCGIPFGPATAVVINFVAVSPAGPGDLRATPFATPMPLAAVINFSNGDPNLAVANGPAVKICNPATTSCTSDITLQADNSAVQVVADVQGYFRNFRSQQVPGTLLTQLQGNVGSAPNAFVGYVNITTNYVPPVNARAFSWVRCSYDG